MTAKATLASAAALLLTSLVLYGWQVTAAWTFSLRHTGGRLADWGFRRPPANTLLLVPLSLLGVYAVTLLHDLLVHPPPQGITESFPHTPGGVALFFIVAVLLAPVAEEIVFRAFLFKGLAASWGWLWGTVASSAIFAIAHAQITILLPLFFLGFTLAWLYERTDSIVACIALHALFNGISVTTWALT